MRRIIHKKFFNRDAHIVARDLLGREIRRRIGSRGVRAGITETEAYMGPHDKASHAHRGLTKRTAPMFGHPGTLYVYLVYGMHYCLNLVTREKGYPAAVLVRAVRLLPSGILINGPGRVTRALAIAKSFNNKNIFSDKRLMLGPRHFTPKQIRKTPRIGVPYAGAWAHKPLRFLIE